MSGPIPGFILPEQAMQTYGLIRRQSVNSTHLSDSPAQLQSFPSTHQTRMSSFIHSHAELSSSFANLGSRPGVQVSLN